MDITNAEYGILASLMSGQLNGEAGDILAKLKPEYFTKPQNRLVFQAIERLFEDDAPIAPLSVKEELKRSGDLGKAGGIAYILALFESLPSIANLEYWLEVFLEDAKKRGCRRIGNVLISISQDPKVTSAEILEEAEKRIFELSQGALSNDPITAGELLKGAFDLIENPAAHMGIPSPFVELDNLTRGFKPGMIVIAGRPSMGKTSFALDIAEHVALNEQKGVALFSLEMSKEQIIINMVSSRSKVNIQELLGGKLRQADYNRYSAVAGDFYDAPIYVDDTPGISMREIRTKARRLKMKHDIAMVIIDYLQLMDSPGKHESRQQEISKISRQVKALARELDVPVIALSQLNRSVDAREDHRPRMSDLRESGALEQDADLIMFLYRAEYYNPGMESGVCEVIVAKQRNGPVGKVKLSFLKDYMRFENYVPDATYIPVKES